MGKIRYIAPELPSLDLKRTRQFYETKLGFKTIVEYDNYLIVERDSAWINYWLCDNPEFARNSSCYIYVDDAKALYAELQPRGVIHPNGQLADKPYGVREFTVVDDNGCLLKFGQDLDAPGG